MKTQPRAARHALLAALASLVVLAAGAQTAAADVTVNMRVETPTETVFNGAVTTGPRTGANGVFRTPYPPTPTDCFHDFNMSTFENERIDVATPSPITAAADYADNVEGVDHIAKDFGWGILLCGLGGYIGDNDDFWLVKINNKSNLPGGGFVTSTTPLSAGDELLWYFTNSSITHTLDVNLPAEGTTGVAVAGVVSKYSNFNDAKTAARGAKLEAGDGAATADINGKFRIKFDQPGQYLVSAESRGTTRGSDVITIADAPLAGQLTAEQKARRVCAKYRRGWRKYNKRYKSIYKRCKRSAVKRYKAA